MKKEFTLSVKEIIKETIIAFITYMVMSCIACAVAWPILTWYSKRHNSKKENEETPSPESFRDVERAEDVRFTDEEDGDNHPNDQDEEAE